MRISATVNSLHVRSVLVLLLAVTPPLAGMLAVGSEWRWHDLAETEQDSQQLIRHAVAIHERILGESERLLRDLAQKLKSSTGRDEEISRLLANLPETHVRFASLTVSRADGRLIVPEPAAGTTTNVSNRPVFRRAVETWRFAAGGYERDETTGQTSVTVAFPVLDDAGRVNCVLLGTLNANWLLELGNEAPLSSERTASIFDQRGTIVMHEPDSRRWVGKSGPVDLGLTGLPAVTHEIAIESASPDGTRRQVVMSPLRADVGRSFVAVAVPSGIATYAVDGTLSRINTWFMLAIGMAIAVVVAGNRVSVVAPLKLLVDATNRLSGGDLTARAGLRSAPEELKQLARAFDQMADVLHLRQAEIARTSEQLAAQGRRFRALVENSTDGILLVDREATIRYASPSTQRLLGFAPEELVGQSAAVNIHPDERDDLNARFARHLAHPSVDEWARYRVRRKDGSWCWLESVGTNLLGDPAVNAVVVNYRDITLRLEAEDRLRAAHDDLERRVETRTAELRLANLALQAEVDQRARVERTLLKLSRAIEQTSDCVFLSDDHGVIEYVNPAFERLTGYSSQEAVGATPRLLKSGRHDRRFYDKLWATIRAGEIFRSVITNRTKDGRIYFGETTITPLRDQDGAITDFVSTGRDVTKSRRTAEALRRMNDRLEHEAARIASALHDDAGQFLTAAHITLADVARELPQRERERLQDVRRNLDEVEQQLRRLAHELRPLILEDMGLADALKFLAEGVARRTGIPISVEVSMQVRCKPLVETALYRLVQEGLTNLSKHAEATFATVVLAQDADNIRCSVIDNG
ncbi:MAG: PAS domain S-box protein, partial [Acidobacteriota bacterium]